MKQDVGPAIIGIRQRTESARAHARGDGVVHPLQPGDVDHIAGDYHRPEAQHHELDEIRNHDRNHAADYGIEQLQQQDRAHGPLERIKWKTCDDGEKRSFNAKEDAHVQEAAGGDQHANQNAQPATILHLEKFGNGHQPERAQPVNHEARRTEEDHDAARNEPVDEGGESGLETELGVVHESNRADFSRRERCDADERAEFASGDKEGRRIGNVFFADETGRDRDAEIDDDDEPVEETEVQGCCSSRSCFSIVRRSVIPRMATTSAIRAKALPAITKFASQKMYQNCKFSAYAKPLPSGAAQYRMVARPC